MTLAHRADPSTAITRSYRPKSGNFAPTVLVSACGLVSFTLDVAAGAHQHAEDVTAAIKDLKPGAAPSHNAVHQIDPGRSYTGNDPLKLPSPLSWGQQ